MSQHLLPIYSTDRVGWRPATPPDLSRYDTIRLDFETNGLRWYAGDRPVGLAVGFGDQEVYLPFGHLGGGNLDEEVVKRWAQRELRGKRIENHTLSFDLHMFRAWGVDVTEQGNTFHDVSHSAALLDDHRYRFNLKALSEEFLPADQRKLDHPINAAHLHTLPAWDVEAYACRDVKAVRHLRECFVPMLTAAGLDQVQALEDDLIPATVALEHNGCPIDEALLAAWQRESQAQLEAKLWEVQRAVGFAVSPGSGPCMERVFRHLGIPITHRTKPSAKFPTGQPSFTAEVLREIDHPVIADIYYCSKLEDIQDKFLNPYAALVHGGVIYPTFHQLANDAEDDGVRKGTVSGRYSAAHPNVQAVLGKDKMKRDYQDLIYAIRRLFIPRGGVWYTADQAQVEFRIAVHVAAVCGIKGAEKLVQRYLDNPETDFHEIVAEMLKPLRPGMTRTEVKVTNFRKLYGGGPRAISTSLKIPFPAAQQLSNQHSRAFPPLRDVLVWAQRRAETRGEVRSVLGRRSTFPSVMGLQERTYAALNRIVQPSAADIFKRTLVDVYRERKTFDFTPRLVVHDELGGDLADASRAAEFTAFLNEQRVPLRVPVLWSGGVGANWHEAKEAA